MKIKKQSAQTISSYISPAEILPVKVRFTG